MLCRITARSVVVHFIIHLKTLKIPVVNISVVLEYLRVDCLAFGYFPSFFLCHFAETLFEKDATIKSSAVYLKFNFCNIYD